ncbi:MAG: glycerol-3-phosphate dehydrogenase [Pseudomonadota bacterium]
MGKVVVLGAGVMGSALTVPAADRGHEVILATTPIDQQILAALSADRGAHPKLGAPLADSIRVVDAGALTRADVADADLVIVGVSSPGVEWAATEAVRLQPSAPMALVTKGLVPATDNSAPLTYADAFPALLSAKGASGLGPLVGIGGPCIARELAERRPTAVVYASADAGAAATAKSLLETDYYRISLSGDVVGVEACAALKNFFAIGVSSMMSRHTRHGDATKNPVAAAFQQAIDELALLAPWLGGTRESAFSLAGVGDLHVTVGGGRNSRLGRHLGEGLSIKAAMTGPLSGETVEGVDVGRVLGPPLKAAIAAGALPEARLPLALALVNAALKGGPLHYDVSARSAAPEGAELEEAAS